MRGLYLCCLSAWALVIVASGAAGATYYIDYAAANDSANGTSTATPWKRCPGMTGFAGTYSHTAGDQFIFKGGVTWPSAALPLTIGYSGTAGNADYYGVSSNWYAGGSYTPPILDGQTNMGQNARLIYSMSKSYFTIDGLKIVNAGNLTDASGECIQVNNGNAIEVKNCVLQPMAEAAFSASTDGVNASHLKFHHNSISQAGRCTIYGWTSYVYDDIEFHDNTWSGCTIDSVGAGYHLDGLMMGNPITGDVTSTSPPTVTNTKFYNNRFYGFWGSTANTDGTAQFFSNGGMSNVWIYNNVFSFENTNVVTPAGDALSPAFVALLNWNSGLILVANNTFSTDAHPSYTPVAPQSTVAVSQAITIGSPIPGYTTFVVKNNIFSGFGNCITYDSGMTVDIDYNLYSIYGTYGNRYIWNAPWNALSLSDCHSRGFETNGSNGDPKFVAMSTGISGSENLSVQASSPAIGAGTNLNAYFTADLVGTTRGANWDIGAYEYTSGAPATGGQTIGFSGSGFNVR